MQFLHWAKQIALYYGARTPQNRPQKAAEITGLSLDLIVASARMFASTKPAVLIRGLATDQIGPNSTRVEHARIALRAITGNLDNEGGNLISGVGPEVNGKKFIRESQLELLDKISPEVKKKQLGHNKYKLMTWSGYRITSKYFQRIHGEPESSMHRLGITPPIVWKAILDEDPYPVRAMITWASNPLMWAANTKATYAALKSPNLELHVVIKLEEVTDNGVIVADKKWNRLEIPADTVVLSLGYLPRSEIVNSFKELASEVYVIGDCKNPKNLMAAVHDGFNVAVEI